MDSVAVTNPCIQNEWEEWKGGMEDNRRRTWEERVSHWAKEVNEDEMDDREEKGDIRVSEEAEGLGEDCEKEEGENIEETEEDIEVKDQEDIEGIKENKHGDELVTKADDGLDVAEEEKEKESHMEGKAMVNEDEEKLVTEAQEVGGKEEDMENIKVAPQEKDIKALREKEEGQNEFWMEGTVSEEMDEVERKDVSDTKEIQVGQENQQQDGEEDEETTHIELKMIEGLPHPLLLEEEVERKEALDKKVEMDVKLEKKDNKMWEPEQNGEEDEKTTQSKLKTEKELPHPFFVEEEVERKESLDKKVELEVKLEKEDNKVWEPEQDEEEDKETTQSELKIDEELPHPLFQEEEVERKESLDKKVEMEVKLEEKDNKVWEPEQDEEEDEETTQSELKTEKELPHPLLLLEEDVERKEALDTNVVQVGQEDQHEVDMEIYQEKEDIEPEQDEEKHDGDDEAEEYIDNITRTEDEIIHANSQSKLQEDVTVFKCSESVESTDNEDCESLGHTNMLFNAGKIKDGEQSLESQINEQSCSSGNPVLEAWTFQERKERKDSEEITAESQKIQEEKYQHDPISIQEEDRGSTDDEEAAEQSNDEDEDEDTLKNYSKDHYPTDIFQTLTQFKNSSLLTDLTLRTENQRSFHVHSPVLAAVSSFIWGHLRRSSRRRNDDTSVGVRTWSVSLGPEVDHIGLEAVVEFAYTGTISSLNEDTVEQIKTAAQALGMPRVLRLCAQEQSVKSGGQKNSAEQRMISLQSIKQLWVEGVGCDVILEALGEAIHAHRVILAASSDYFRGMFTSGMKESSESSVVLPFLTAPDLEALISCSYSGVLSLSWRCVFETTSTALQLQCQPALSLCLRFLQQEMNPHYCLDVASFAEAYEIVQLLEVADDFVLRQFQKVAQTSKFKDLPAKQLLRYLNSHSLCVSSELVVFKAVVTWIQAKPKRRLRLAKELMKTIHFPLMTFKEFKEVQSLNIWSDHSLAELYETVFHDFCSSDTITQSQCRIYLPKESLVLIGGDQISEDMGSRSISRELWFGNSLRNHTGIKKAMEWRRLGEMPEPARFSHEVAVLKGQLYVFGGKKYYGISDTLNSVCRYDPLQNHWENLAEMQQNRCSFSVIALNDKLYALGGHCDPDYIDSVEQYCPTANAWSYAWPLDLPLSGHVAKVLQGKIFISGGRNSDYQSLSSMFLYHPEAGSTYMANMIKPRAHHCMETLGENLYVAGGITTDDNTSVVDQLTCEVYSPAADSWSAFASLPVPHVGAGSAVLEGKFYVLGGYSQEDYTDTKMVHRYDPTLQRWENMGKMPGPNNDIRASLLCLPPHLRL